MPKVRLGVVLLVPPPLATEVDALRRAVGDPALGRIAPHVTLVPPVNVNVERLDEALAVVRAAAAAAPRTLQLTLGPPQTFLPVTPVLYLSVGGDVEPLRELRQRLFQPPLLRSVDHDFVPHVTLADGIDPELVSTALVGMAAYAAVGSFERVHVLQQGDDRVWQPFADAPLGPPAVVGRGGIEVELTVTERPQPGGELLFHSARPFSISARIDGRLVGSATGAVGDDVAFLHDLRVGPEERGMGIGARLLAAVEALAVKRDCELLVAAPHPFLERHGWTDGRRRLHH